jgi:hypothetical protein
VTTIVGVGSLAGVTVPGWIPRVIESLAAASVSSFAATVSRMRSASVAVECPWSRSRTRQDSARRWAWRSHSKISPP